MKGRAPKRVEKAHFLNFEVTFLEILRCRTKTDAGFGISGPKLVVIKPFVAFWLLAAPGVGGRK